MIDPELMTDVSDDDGPTQAFGALAVLALAFCIGFAAGYLVAWL
jgi:hypothetical protein